LLLLHAVDFSSGFTFTTARNCDNQSYPSQNDKSEFIEIITVLLRVTVFQKPKRF